MKWLKILNDVSDATAEEHKDAIIKKIFTFWENWGWWMVAIVLAVIILMNIWSVATTKKEHREEALQGLKTKIIGLFLIMLIPNIIYLVLKIAAPSS